MYVAWRDLRFAKGRFALMGAVIVLITLLVGLLSGLTAGLGQQNISAVTRLPADRIAFAAPAGGEELSYASSVVREEQWQRLGRADGVRSAEPVGIASVRAAAGDRHASVAAFGVQPGSGIGPGGVREGEIALTEPAAEELGVDNDDGAEVAVAGREFTVRAIEGDDAYSHLPVVWTHLGDWQHLAPGAAEGGRSATTATVVAVDADPAALPAADRAAGTRTVTTGDSLAAIGSYASENGSLQLMRGFLFAISALVIGAFFTVWTIQRAGDIAVLKALGASTRGLLTDALGQALILLTGGTLLGTALAAGIGALVSGSAVPFALAPGTVLGPAAVLIALGALGAALSVRRITSVDPLTALGSAR
ncbi:MULTISPECIES: ABC transporter permease [Streptomyces]|uniref:ABC transporter permease n=1 Tax=Streptomyces odorifer TaxID=53450 RepID=A0A7Y6C9A5_9ACTN|nr:ABC transporter permease [Streptomyces odorifer]NUV29417.1 ABC transporter permease [Streptomyces odorifer]NUV38410.1 ABC transporter permease [Streptomyces sp. KAI-27]NUV50845.1 ABC transporter permease [Streptomyces sp. CAI-78]